MTVPIEAGTLVAKRYRVERALGKGGMGEVFAAENIRTGRHVAIKVLRAESKQKASAVERFRREAKAAGAIVSDHVTQVLDVEDDPEHGIVLVFELLQGESLVERLKRTGPLSFTELWPVVEAVWIGLADAHAAGIVHRDLKPSNVFLETRPGSAVKRVKILDFGISKLPKQMSSDSLTQVGQSLGTFSFMPPEQIGKAKNVDHRADIYACATLIYQGLSGQLPYQAKNVVTMMELKGRIEPRSLREAMGAPVDPRLEAFIAKGLARDPDARFQSALEALEAWRTLRPTGAYSFGDADSGPGVYSVEGQRSRAGAGARPSFDGSGTLPGPASSPHSSTASTAPLSGPTTRRVRPAGAETPPAAGPAGYASAPGASALHAEPTGGPQYLPSAAPSAQPIGGGGRPTYPSSAPGAQVFQLPSLVPLGEGTGAEDGVTVPRIRSGQSFGSGTIAMNPNLPAVVPSADPMALARAAAARPVAYDGAAAPRAAYDLEAARSNAPPPTRFEAPDGSQRIVAVTAPRSRRRLWLAFVLGALGLMVVGFVAVALLMRLLGQG
ncbi:MAG: protein kinase [Polyangiaceae bacterium]|nr:protein kinase [Polyangiaceae bacterium]